MKRIAMVCAAVLFLSYPAASQWVRSIDALANWAGFVDPDSMSTSGMAVDPTRGYLYVYGYARTSSAQLYRSADGGETWTTLTNARAAFNGGCGGTMGFSFNLDPQTGRLACFITHGTSSYTLDYGLTWDTIATQPVSPYNFPWGYDWGGVDWISQKPSVFYMYEHGSANAYLSADTGKSYRLMGNYAAGWGTLRGCLGVMDSVTLVLGDTGGIFRSPDLGNTWSKVSTMRVQGRSPVRYGSRYYWTTGRGVVVTEDKGLTWRLLSNLPEATWGPYFGTTEQTMVVVNGMGVQKSVDGGLTWSRIVGYPTGVNYSVYAGPASFGWDPIRDIYYCAVSGGSLYSYHPPATAAGPVPRATAAGRPGRPVSRAAGCTIRGQTLAAAMAPGLYIVGGRAQVVDSRIGLAR